MSILTRGWNFLKKVPVAGNVITSGEMVFGDKSIQDTLYEKLVRISVAGGIVAGAAAAPLASVGLGFVTTFLTDEAISDGRLQAEIRKLSKKQATAAWMALLPIAA